MLTPSAVANAKPQAKPYKLADERGMYLLVKPDGARWWRFDYPGAWQHIEDEMQKARDGYATTFVPVAAEVLTVDGDEVLEIVAVSDISIAEDGEDSFARMTFRAKLTQS